MFGAAVGRVRVPYGWVEFVKTLGFFLLLVLTLFLCQGRSNGEWRIDFHLDEPNNQPTVTASHGVISLSAETLDNSNMIQVVSHSSVPVDTVVKAKDGHDFFTYFGLMPGESFYFGYENPCTITAVAS